jgi:ribonuclease H2 subunit B
VPVLSASRQPLTPPPDGGVYTATAVDVVFILLPALERHRQRSESHEGRFCSLEVLLEDEASPALASLQPLAAAALASVCAVQEAGEDSFYRLDDERLLAWLSIKAERVAAALHSGAAAGSAFDALGADALLSYSVELLGEYLPPAWVARLRAHCGCAGPPAEEAPLPLPTGGGGGGGGSDRLDGPGDAKKAKPGSAAAAAKASATRVANAKVANAKAAEGTASLRSFFSPPKAK